MATVKDMEWDKLEDQALDQLDNMKGKCDIAYFFLGISLYKQEHYS